MARSLTSMLFRAARLSATTRAVRRSVTTGSAKPLARRAKNMVVGRTLAQAGFWRRLWR